jgi:serine/threonine-protein kinase
VDARADVWAYGVVLYEMLAGRRLFDGKTTSDTLAAVLKEEPDWRRVPAGVRRLLRSCLQKDPKQRLHDIADAKLLLEGDSDAETPTVGRLALMAWIAAAAFALASVALLGFLLRSPRQEPRPASRWSENYGNDTVGGVALSRDGTRLAYIEGAENLTGLRVRDLDQREPKVIAGPVSPLRIFVYFSPDGQWLAYFERTGELKKIPVTGGTPIALCADGFTDGGGGVSWGDDGNIVFTGKNGGLMRVSASGGACETLTAPEPKTREIHGKPQVLPGSRSVLFTIGVPGAYDNARTAVLDLKSRRYRVVANVGAAARYAPTGHLVYVRGGTLYAVSFDWKRLAVTGAEAAVGGDVFYNPAGGFADYDFADSGLLVYRPPIPKLKTLEWRDRNGVAEPLLIPPRDYSLIQVSPDGRQAAVKIDKSFRNGDLWIVDLRAAPWLSSPPALQSNN